MKNDRFLIGILAGIAVLILAALVIFFIRQGEGRSYLEETTPDNIVHNYVLALQQGDYDKAYGYLGGFEGRPSYANFRAYFETEYNRPRDYSLQISGWEEGPDNTAWVNVSTVQVSVGPFSGVNRMSGSAQLARDASGDWKIQGMPYPFWGWDWFKLETRP